MEQIFEIEVLQNGSEELDAQAQCTCTQSDPPACCCIIA